MTRLAIHGGKPVRATMLPYARQRIDETDIQGVVEVLRSDWLTTGPAVEAFERAVAEYVGSQEAVVVNSGTAALHAAVFAANIGPGDEVIVPAITFVATANCVLYRGGRPVFADVLPGTLTIDPTDLERKITPRTKALIPVDYAGQPCDHDAIRAIAEAHGLMVIEDAAHALGATYRGRRVGTLHPLTILSFHPVKHITTGEGGMVTTDDRELAQRMRMFRNHGITTDFRQRSEAGSWLYDMIALGYNYRLPDINCALGIQQLKKLDSWLLRRRAIAERYRTAFKDLATLELLEPIPDGESAWHLFVIKLKLEQLRVGRKEIFAALRAENIGVNVHYKPVYWHPYYQQLGYPRGLCPIAEAEYERILSLPLFPAMTEKDVEDVIEALCKVLQAF